jgi:hypothetical protein
MQSSSTVQGLGKCSGCTRGSAHRRGVRRLPAVRQELFDATLRMGLHAREHLSQVVDGVDTVLLAGRYEREENRVERARLPTTSAAWAARP